MAIFEFRAETDEHLRNHLLRSAANAKYTSHQVQNELIGLCGEQIAATIISECKDAKYYTILAYDSSDVSCTEQVSLCLRYVVDEGKTFSKHAVK